MTYHSTFAELFKQTMEDENDGSLVVNDHVSTRDRNSHWGLQIRGLVLLVRELSSSAPALGRSCPHLQFMSRDLRERNQRWSLDSLNSWSRGRHRISLDHGLFSGQQAGSLAITDFSKPFGHLHGLTERLFFP